MLKIVWDWNGTLLNDMELSNACINRLLEKNNKAKLTQNQYREVFGFPIQDYYIKAGFDFEQTPWEQLASEYIEDYMSQSDACSLNKGAYEALKASKKAGFDNFIVSASHLENLKRQLDNYDLSGVLDGVFGITDIYAHSKTELAKEFKNTCLKEDILYCIGDTEHDAQVAQTIDAQCVLVTTGHQSRHRLEATGFPVKDSLWEAFEYIYERNSH